MANKKSDTGAIENTETKQKKHILSGLSAIIEPCIIDGKEVDTVINYYIFRNGRQERSRTPYSTALLIREPIRALKVNAGFQHLTNATEEQMQFIFKTSLRQLIQIEKTLNNVK